MPGIPSVTSDPSTTAAAPRRYTSIRALQRDLATCRLCVEAGYPLESLPVVHGTGGRHAYLFGQAPGIVEGGERAPWRGRAGKTLRRWLELDEDAFYATFYCAAVTRCYPGRAGGRGDRTPTPAERRLCARWRDEELRLLRPRLVLTVGGLAAQAIVGARSLTECIGKSYLIDGAITIPLPHPSGASGWLNDPVNRKRLGKALTHARREIARLDELSRPERHIPEAVCDHDRHGDRP
jgi:uracil-DNA glycosylase